MLAVQVGNDQQAAAQGQGEQEKADEDQLEQQLLHGLQRRQAAGHGDIVRVVQHPVENGDGQRVDRRQGQQRGAEQRQHDMHAQAPVVERDRVGGPAGQRRPQGAEGGERVVDHAQGLQRLAQAEHPQHQRRQPGQQRGGFADADLQLPADHGLQQQGGGMQGQGDGHQHALRQRVGLRVARGSPGGSGVKQGGDQAEDQGHWGAISNTRQDSIGAADLHGSGARFQLEMLC